MKQEELVNDDTNAVKLSRQNLNRFRHDFQSIGEFIPQTFHFIAHMTDSSWANLLISWFLTMSVTYLVSHGFLAILHFSKWVKFIHFGIRVVFLTCESKTRVESLKSNSTRIYVSLWYCIVLELNSFHWVASPKTKNQNHLESCLIASPRLGLRKK